MPGMTDDKQAARLAHRMRAFARAHGGSAEGQVSHLGRSGARIVLVGADGAWGDLISPGGEEPARRAAGEAGVPLRGKTDPEPAGRMRTGRYEWSRMAGLQLGGGRAGV